MTEPQEPVWIEHRVVLAVHDEQISEHGGGSGLRDEGLLESALARPVNQFTRGGAEPDLA
jgi:death-on-curing protein